MADLELCTVVCGIPGARSALTSGIWKMNDWYMYFIYHSAFVGIILFVNTNFVLAE